MNTSTLARKLSSENKSFITMQKSVSKSPKFEMGLNKILSSLSSDTLSLHDSDIEVLEDFNELNSELKTPFTRLSSQKSFHYNPYFYNDDILPSIPETRTKVEDTSLVTKAKDMFQDTKSFMEIHKYQLRADKSALSQLLMQKSMNVVKEFTSFDYLPNKNEEVYSSEMVDLSSNDLSSEIMLIEYPIEQNTLSEEKQLYDNTSQSDSRPKLMRTETLSSSEMTNYLNGVKSSITNQNDDDDDFLKLFR